MNNIQKGQVNNKKFSYDDDGLREAIAYATQLMQDKKQVTFKWHDEEYEKSLTKEGGADGGGFGDGGGTVAVSTDSGFFTPTYGERDKRKKTKKKRTGIHRLADFITGNSPERKMMQKNSEFTLNLVDWVGKELKKDDIKFRQQTSSEDINPQTKITDDQKNPVEFDGEPDKNAAIEQKDMEQKIRNLDDDEDIKHNKPDEKGDAGQTAPAGLSVQLQYGSGPERGPLVTGASKDKESGVVEEIDEESEEVPFEKIVGKDLYKKLLGD